MLPVDPSFTAATTGSHRVVNRIRLITPGATGADPPGRDLALVTGSVTLDGRAQVRATFSATLSEPWPATYGTDQVAPYGTEVAVTRGIDFGNGRIVRCPLGIFRLDKVDQDGAPFGTLAVTGEDRMARIVESRLLAPVSFPSGTTYGSILSTLVLDVLPAAVIEWDDATDALTTGKLLVSDDDRYAFLNDMVTGLGKIWHFDYRGVLVVKSPPDPAVAVARIAAGAGGTLTNAHRSLDRSGVYNAVVASGDQALDDQTPARAVVVDDDPASLTYWEGPFGQVPEFYSSPFLETDLQAESAARALLLTAKGIPYGVAVDAVPNPALEPFDGIDVVYPLNILTNPKVLTEHHVIDQITMPLDVSSTMALVTRLTTLTA